MTDRTARTADTNVFTSSTSTVIAGCFALTAFGIAVVSGLAGDNPAAQILMRAFVVMLLCYPLGWVIGLICQHVINDHVRAHVEANPAPDSSNHFPIAEERDRRRADDDDEILEV